MDYNKSTEIIRLREFGRNIQQMVDYLLTLDDREKRSGMAQEVVRIMACLTPSQKDTPENSEKLWDQLYQISDYQLDIDSPFPKPDKKEVKPNPTERMPYIRQHPKYRQYGVNVESMIKAGLEMTDPEEQKALFSLTANIMKHMIKGGDKDAYVEVTVKNHLREMVGNKLLFELESIEFSKVQPVGPKAVNPVNKNNKNFFQKKKPFGNFNRTQGNTGGGGNGGGYRKGGFGKPGGPGSNNNNNNNRPKRPRV